MKISRTERFKKAWLLLSISEKSLAKKAIDNLVNNITYPSLRVKKIKGVEKIWEARVSISLRMTFQVVSNTIILRNIGRHDDTIRSP